MDQNTKSNEKSAKIELKDPAKKSASMLVFGLPLLQAEDEARRKEDDIARVFATLQTTSEPVGSIGLELSSAREPPPVLIKLRATTLVPTPGGSSSLQLTSYYYYKKMK